MRAVTPCGGPHPARAAQAPRPPGPPGRGGAGPVRCGPFRSLSPAWVGRLTSAAALPRRSEPVAIAGFVSAHPCTCGVRSYRIAEATRASES